jgi:hypothetical protein
LISRDRVVEALAPVESVTVNATVKEPACEGVPETRPPEEIDSPAEKPVPEKLYGPVPSEAIMASEYPVPTCPAGKVVVLIESFALAVEELPDEDDPEPDDGVALEATRSDCQIQPVEFEN